MKKLLYAAVALLYFSACAPDKFKTVRIDNLYSLDVPSYLKKVDAPNASISSAYYDSLSKLTLIVMLESIDTMKQVFAQDSINRGKSNDLEHYTKIIINQMASNCESHTMTPFKYEKIDGLEAIVFDWSAKIKGHKLYSKKAFIKGKSNYFQITPLIPETKKLIYEKTMDRIIHSFKEL